jgi:drug/metabolite transporter (DMT)-like permease
LSSLVLALGASLAWGFADFFGPLVSRTLGSLRVLFWAQVGGLLAIAIAVAIRGQGPAGWAVLFAILASLGGMLGLFAYYRGMQEGAMSVVAPIAGISAIVPVIFGIASGDSPSTPQIAGIACALAGVGLASIEHHEGSPRVAAGVGLALLAAVGFGFYFPWMHAAGKVDFWWASLVFRATALLLLVAVVGARHTPPQAASARPRDRGSGRDRRHDRERSLCRVVEGRPRQPDFGARVALSGRDRPARGFGAARTGGADAAGRHRADAGRRRVDLVLIRR